jgi:hypothetical protein
MNSSYPTTFQNGKLVTNIFNIGDFKSNYSAVTMADLLDYGNLFAINNWIRPNYFQSIISKTINGVLDSTFQFFKNVTEDIQSAINDFRNRLTKVTYSNSNGSITKIDDTLLTDRLTAKQNINCNKIVSFTSLSSNIITSKIYTDILVVDSIESKQPIYTGLYFILFGTTYPIKRTTLMSSLNTGNNVLDGRFHIDSNFRVKITNSNNVCIFDFRNTTSNFMYNNNIILNDVKEIQLYYNNILL